MRTKILLIIAILVNITANAQTPAEQIANRMNYVFEKLNKNEISTGLLSNYGIQPIDLDYYDGTPSDSNYVNFKNFMLIYAGIYSAKINNNITLKTPDLVTEIIEKANHNNATPVAFMHYNYNKLKEDGVTQGLVKVVNDQIIRINDSISPYQTKTLFAVTPQKTSYNNANVSFVFKYHLRFSNVNKTIKNFQIRFDKTLSYVKTNWNVPVSYTYNNSGVKEVTFRVNYTDGTFLDSKTNILLTASSLRKRDVSFSYDNIYIQKTNRHSGGKLQIKYAPGNHSGKIQKALIVAEGFDPMRIMGNGNMDICDFLDENDDVGSINNSYPNLYKELQINNYDIVYLDYNDGVDDIRRNATLMQEAISWVNNHKEGNHPNIVMGISMGGLVARYALRKMELAGIDHQTWKYISIDSPHKGANVPVGFQAAVKHIASQELRVFFMTALKSTWLSRELDKALEILNSKATKQMLIYRVKGNGYDNSEHEEFMAEYESLGFPEKCQNIAVSNGNNMGKTLFSPGSQMLNYHKSINFKVWQEILNNTIGIPLSGIFIISNHPELLLNMVPGKTQIQVSAIIKSIKGNSENSIYSGRVQFKKKIFWLINSTVNITRYSHHSKKDMLPIDNAQGGIYDLRILKLPSNILSHVRQEKFCFVPTVSALSINNWKDYLNSNLSGKDLFTEGKTNFEYTYSPYYSEIHTSFYNNTNFLRNHVKAPPIYINKLSKTFCGSQTIKINNIQNKIINWYSSNNDFTISSPSNTSTQLSSPPFLATTIIKASSGEAYPLRKRILTNCNLRISGPDIICSSATYTVENLPPNNLLTWSSSNDKVYLHSGQGTNTVEFRHNYKGKSIIKAKINMNGSILNLSKEIWSGTISPYNVGAHLVDSETGEYIYELCTNTHNDCKLIYSAGNSDIDKWDWSTTGGDAYSYNTEYVTVYVYDKKSFVLKLRAHNECGWSNWAEMNILGSDCNGGWYYSISPNPVNSQLHINLTAEAKQIHSLATKTRKLSSEVTVNIWNSVQILKTFTIKQDDNISIPVNDLSRGIYYLEIKTGDKVERHKFIKK